MIQITEDTMINEAPAESTQKKQTNQARENFCAQKADSDQFEVVLARYFHPEIDGIKGREARN